MLSSALGLQKSFSTSDISQLPSPEETPHQLPQRCAVSELALSSVQRSGYLLDHPRLDHASRSCSTWVAVGDVASTSQLPSPHGGHTTTAPAVSAPPAFTAADLIRSVNKKVSVRSVPSFCVLDYFRTLHHLQKLLFKCNKGQPRSLDSSVSIVTSLRA